MYSPTPPSCPDQGKIVPEGSTEFENLEWNGDERHDNCQVDPILRDAAQTAYLGLVDNHSGESVDIEKWSVGYNHARKLEQQSLQIAEAIERAGGQPWQDRQSLKLVGLCTGEIRELPNVKDWNIFPVVARRKRAAVVKHLEWYMDTSPKRFRMWVFTGGERFTWINNAQGFDERMTELTRRISKLNNKDFMKMYGVRIVWRQVEIAGDTGFLRDEDGNPTMHLHAHCMVQMDRKLDHEDFCDLIGRVGAYWKWHWKEAKEIHDTREVCKYMNKPADTLKLSDQEIKSLAEVCHGRQFARMSGPFQERCKDLKDSGMRIDFIKDKWVMNPNWNGRTKGARALVELEGDGNDVVDPIGDEQPKPTAVAYTKPAPIFVPYREPCVLVANWDGKSELILSEFGQEVRESAISIYTTSITVPEKPSAFTAGSDPPQE